MSLVIVVFSVLAACGGGTGGTGLPCRADDFGCRCSSEVDPDEGIACTAAEQGDDGFCCASTTDDSDQCLCVRPGCARPNDNPDFCSCGPDLFESTDTIVASCQPAPGQHCCLDDGLSLGALCVCSSLECGVAETEVSSCTTEQTDDCGDFAELVDACS